VVGDDDDRSVGLTDDGLRHAPEQGRLQPAAPARSHDDLATRGIPNRVAGTERAVVTDDEPRAPAP
jgi:hypothetical protein